MKEPRIFSLQEEVRREAEHIKKELEEDPALEDIVVTEEMDAALLELIRGYEKEEKELDRKAAEFSEELAIRKEDLLAAKERLAAVDGSKTAGEEDNKIIASGEDKTDTKGDDKTKIVRFRTRRIPKRAMVSVAALAVLVMALGMTSAGSKSYTKLVFDKIMGDNRVRIISQKDTDYAEVPDDESEGEILGKYGKKMGVNIPELVYKPSGMRMTGYAYQEDMKNLSIFYEYQEQTIEYMIYSSDSDASLGIAIVDEQVGEYLVKAGDKGIKVEEFDVSDQDKNRFVASIVYGDTYLQLTGIMEKQEFMKIVENMYFL